MKKILRYVGLMLLTVSFLLGTGMVILREEPFWLVFGTVTALVSLFIVVRESRNS